MPDIDDTNQTYDAQALVQEIAKGEEKAPKVDVSADYEASKQFSQSEIDRTGEGAKAAAEATAPQFEVPQAEETTTVAEPTGDPADYKEMAKEVNPHLKA